VPAELADQTYTNHPCGLRSRQAVRQSANCLPSVSPSRRSTREESLRRSSRVVPLPGATSSSSRTERALNYVGAPAAGAVSTSPVCSSNAASPLASDSLGPRSFWRPRGHLVMAQVRVVFASRADNLILARVPAINMAVDHAGGPRPENRGAVIVPRDAVTDRH
jgi:hypothetical protein